MTETADQIDQIMEQASHELVAMSYAACERSCIEALRLAMAASDWDRFARILLPLQEARRQRRQIAEDAGVIVLTEKMTAEAILDQHEAGCLLLLDPPYTDADEQQLRELARERAQFIEVLRLNQDGLKAAYLAALEDRGDAALADLRVQDAHADQIATLYRRLDQIGDHEIAHQRLASLARELARA